VPQPIAATRNGPANLVTVFFDLPLVAGTGWDAANWIVRCKNKLYPVVTVTTTSSRVLLAVDTMLFPSPGPDGVSYMPPPFDVRSRSSGLPVAPFSDYPLTT